VRSLSICTEWLINASRTSAGWNAALSVRDGTLVEVTPWTDPRRVAGEFDRPR
jgi:hypothetical protein